jgi:hypothetical protein
VEEVEVQLLLMVILEDLVVVDQVVLEHQLEEQEILRQ